MQISKIITEKIKTVRNVSSEVSIESAYSSEFNGTIYSRIESIIPNLQAFLFIMEYTLSAWIRHKTQSKQKDWHGIGSVDPKTIW